MIWSFKADGWGSVSDRKQSPCQVMEGFQTEKVDTANLARRLLKATLWIA